ncbi:hypothetical protein SBA4_7260004 [Candidatus Sulfopaludibacter sp. SbA4]|nr:hypothetical protein SBA4_7260004 [Candidatus Sulfopaludibacter sp. SbA4]
MRSASHVQIRRSPCSRAPVDVCAHVMKLLVLARQLVIHEVPHGEEGDHAGAAGHGQMPAIVRVHQLHGMFQAGQLVDRRQGGAHHVFDRRLFRIAPFQHHALHQVALAEYAAKLIPIQDQDGAHMAFRHLPGHLGHAAALFHMEELTAMYDISDQGHRYPSRTQVKTISQMQEPGDRSQETGVGHRNGVSWKSPRKPRDPSVTHTFGRHDRHAGRGEHDNCQV